MAFRFEPVNVNELVAEAVEATSGFASKLPHTCHDRSHAQRMAGSWATEAGG